MPDDDNAPGDAERPPAVTVVIPCYNTHEHLAEALDSVRAQTFRDFEIMVVDDGSNDPEAVAFLDAVGDDVRLIRQDNQGLPAARNTGFRQARGELVLPLDCDDALDPSFLDKAVAALRAAPPNSFVFSYLRLAGSMQGVLKKNYNHFEQLFFNQLPYCLLIRKALWEEVGGYDESMRQGYEDWEFNIRLGEHGVRGIVLREPLFHYRVSETGMLKSVSQKQHGELWCSIQQKNPSAYRLRALIRSWRTWRHEPSTYPLLLYFGWLAVFRVLPKSAFSALFRRLLPYRHSVRAAVSSLAGK